MNPWTFKWLTEARKYFYDPHTKKSFISTDPTVGGAVAGSFGMNFVPTPVWGPMIHSGVIASRRKKENELLRKYAKAAGAKEITKQEFKSMQKVNT